MRSLQRRVSLASACATAFLLAGSVATMAVQPRAVTITAHTERGCPSSSSCVFVATGAIDDSGTVSSVLLIAAALPAPVVGTAQWLKTFEGQKGSFTIRLQSLVTFVGDSLQAPETGHWVLVDGTGVYAGLLGQGAESGIRDYGAQSLDAILTGQVH